MDKEVRIPKEAKSEALKHKLEGKEVKLEHTALRMEKEAIATYKKLIKDCDDERERKIYEEILRDEEDHEKKLKKIIKEE